MGICFLLSLIVITSAAYNYQERNLYYNESDNVCKFGSESDSINLTIVLNRSETIRLSTIGATCCDKWIIPYWGKLIPNNGFGASYGPHDSIVFHDETKRVYKFGILMEVIQKTTVEEIIIDNVKYTCEILGNDIVEHFGHVNIHVVCEENIEKLKETLNEAEIFQTLTE